MNMRATRKIFCHLESFSSRDDKKSWGWLSYSYTTSILWNNGFVSRSTTQENMLQTIFTVTHESFHCVTVLVTRGNQRENDIISKQSFYSINDNYTSKSTLLQAISTYLDISIYGVSTFFSDITNSIGSDFINWQNITNLPLWLYQIDIFKIWVKITLAQRLCHQDYFF